MLGTPSWGGSRVSQRPETWRWSCWRRDALHVGVGEEIGPCPLRGFALSGQAEGGRWRASLGAGEQDCEVPAGEARGGGRGLMAMRGARFGAAGCESQGEVTGPPVWQRGEVLAGQREPQRWSRAGGPGGRGNQGGWGSRARVGWGKGWGPGIRWSRNILFNKVSPVVSPFLDLPRHQPCRSALLDWKVLLWGWGETSGYETTA